jgi:hypothetical protein
MYKIYCIFKRNKDQSQGLESLEIVSSTQHFSLIEVDVDDNNLVLPLESEQTENDEKTKVYLIGFNKNLFNSLTDAYKKDHFILIDVNELDANIWQNKDNIMLMLLKNTLFDSLPLVHKSWFGGYRENFSEEEKETLNFFKKTLIEKQINKRDYNLVLSKIYLRDAKIQSKKDLSKALMLRLFFYQDKNFEKTLKERIDQLSVSDFIDKDSSKLVKNFEQQLSSKILTILGDKALLPKFSPPTLATFHLFLLEFLWVTLIFSILSLALISLMGMIFGPLPLVATSLSFSLAIGASVGFEWVVEKCYPQRYMILDYLNYHSEVSCEENYRKAII